MPTLKLRLATLVQSLSEELLLAEALLFPGASCLNDRLQPLRKMLALRVREMIKGMPPGDIYRHRLADLPELRQIEIDVPPVRGDVHRSEAVTIAFHYAQWRHGTEAVIAAVPALGIEVLADNEQQLAEQLGPQIRSALARRRSAESLRDLVMLANVRRLDVRPLTVAVKLPTLKQAAQQEQDSAASQKSVLKEAATDLTRQPHPPLFERDELVARLAQLLSGRSPRSVLLIGPSGVGKTALVRELARRRGEFNLEGTPLWSTSGSRLIAGMSGFGVWQERCQKLIREAAKTKAVVHLDNLIELIEVGKGGGNSQGIAAMLRPAIAAGELLAIAECTPEQLAIVEREDPQLLEAFMQLEVQEPSVEQTRAILAGVAGSAARNMSAITAPALAELDRLHRRYATYSASPGRPLRFLRNLLEDRPRDRTLNVGDVTAAFSHETGLPLFMLDDALPLDLEQTRRWLAQRVMGQPEPIELVTDLLASVKAGLARSGKPIASLLFIGPTGVGKTEMAKALAEFLYRDPGRMIRFDMSEYAHPAAIDRLIGGAYSSQGLLTQKVRDQPFMVVLLDEFEKAHPSLFDVLLQVLGEGRLTDGGGRVADFTNSVVIMTSNLGAESYRKSAVGFAGQTVASTTAQRHFEREVKAFLRPEMFNRLDRIVPFSPLSAETIAEIARREIERLRHRDGLRLRGVKLEVADEAIAELAASGYDPRYGARPLKRAIERQLVNPLAERLCHYVGELAIESRVRLVDGELSVETTATPLGKGIAVAASGDPRNLAELHELLTLRRKAQLLQRSGVVLRLRNEIYRLRQAEERRQRKLKRRGKAPSFTFTAEQARMLAQQQLLTRIDALVHDASSLEDSALGDLYANRSLDLPGIAAARKQLDLDLRSLLFELHKVQNESRGQLTLCIFGAALERVLELSVAYEHVCSAHPVNLNRYWLKMHDRRLDEAARSAGAGRSQGTPAERPVMHLLHRKRHDDDHPAKVVDVFRPQPHQFNAPPADVIGVALQIQGEQPVALLETETGRHEFRRSAGKPEECFVETHNGLLLKYEPPPDCGRANAFSDLLARRTYDFPRELCTDHLLEQGLRIRGRSIDEAVAQATADYLIKRMWLLLD